MSEYQNTDNTNGRLRKYILPATFDFTAFPTDYDNAILEIRHVHDLEGSGVTFPENVTLLFNGGRITNYGLLVGNETKIEAGLDHILDGVVHSVDADGNADYDKKFAGSWNLEQIVPQWFGAVSVARDGDNNITSDDFSAFQAMFNFVKDINIPIPVHIPAGFYYTSQTIEFFTPSKHEQYFEISGYGANIRTSQPGVSIFKRMPRDQNHAGLIVGDAIPIIKGISFQGSSVNPINGNVNRNDQQKGLEVGATYSMVVEDCSFSALEYGAIGTFCLASKWKNLRFSTIDKFPLTLQSAGADYYGNSVWSGASISNSASNVSIIDGCRVYGKAGQIGAYAVLGSDSIKVLDCVSEGGGDLYDMFFNYQGSNLVNNFTVDGFHAEAKNTKVNMKLRGGGNMIIKNLRRSFSAALFDFSGSGNSDIEFDGLAYLTGLPTPAFYHTNGNGYGGDVEGGASVGSSFSFKNCGSTTILKDPAYWENGILPPRFSLDGYTGEGFRGLETVVGPYLNLVSVTQDIPDKEKSPGYLTLENLAILFKQDNTQSIGKRGSVRNRPKGIALGEDGIEFYSRDEITDCINGGFFIYIGSIPANSTKTIVIDANTVNPITAISSNLIGLNKEFVTDVNIVGLPSGVIVGSVETMIDALSITFANITGSEIDYTDKRCGLYFNSLRR